MTATRNLAREHLADAGIRQCVCAWHVSSVIGNDAGEDLFLCVDMCICVIISCNSQFPADAKRVRTLARPKLRGQMVVHE
jgi:hypothetical protein